MSIIVRHLYHSVSTLGIRLSGVKTGKNVLLSAKGKIRISGGSSVTLADNVILAKDYQIDAHGGSEITIGANVHFGEGVRIHAEHGSKITIDEGCSFNYHVSIIALHAIAIGKQSIFGPYVYLSDHNHQIAKAMLIKDQGYDTQQVSIGSDVWMGVGATVIKGGSVGDGSIVAARAVVNKPVPPYEIWGGIPARKIGERV